jgi:hypothetical protein
LEHHPIASHFRDKTSMSRLSVLLPVLLSLLSPLSAWSDIYKWTDERGNTVISNVAPPNPNKVKDVELLVKETPRSAAQRAETPTEQMLQERIDRLERQVQAQRYTPPPQASPPVTYHPSEYPAPPPPAPDYFGSYYPSFYPPYSFVVFPGRTVRSRRLAFTRGHFGHSATGTRGRR